MFHVEHPIFYFEEMFHVEHLIQSKLDLYMTLLRKWSKQINLVGSRELDCLEERHLQDSIQLFNLVDNKSAKIMDLGSGAGFPGLVLSILGCENVTLVEANKKKAIFLNEVIRQTGSKAIVLAERLEHINGEDHKVSIITSRAFAELDIILEYAHKFLLPDGFCLLLKGETVDIEIKKAQKKFQFTYEKIPSKTDCHGCILKVRLN